VTTGYRFNVGDFACTVVSDGTIRVPPPPHTGLKFEDGEVMDVTCLLIERDGRRLLIDTGCGSGFQDTAGKLLENLKKEGVDPATIETIVYTHGHTDHVGGTFDAAGRPVFPNARQVALKVEWDSWSALPPENEHYHMFDAARDNLLPIREKFDLVEENAEVAPGVRLLPAYGHSPGNAMVGLSSGDDRLLCVGDLIHSQRELAEPAWYAFLDVIPGPAEQLRSEGIAEIAFSGVPVYACHFPFPGLGRFVYEGEALRWQPTVTATG
jgi:glyoxylase-like metal-dependent hydrolase (beta-lactamase superfamily II)